jgi:hypothetical protein
MGEPAILEAKETLHAETTQVKVTKGAPKDTQVTVSSIIIPTGPQKKTDKEDFTRADFEGVLDKVSRDEADAADALAALGEKGEVTWEEVKRKHGL